MPSTDVEQWKFYFQALAFGVAVVALLLTWLTHAQRSNFDMIDRMYSLCHTLEGHVLKEWRVGHLFAITQAEYESVKRRIEVHTQDADVDELLVKEKLFAVHIFVVYEQVLYQWKSSSRLHHHRRREFLGEMISYFTDRLLANPRLVHLLLEDPEGTSLHLEQASRRRLDAMLRSKAHLADSKGPFIRAGSPTQSTPDSTLADVPNSHHSLRLTAGQPIH